MDPIELEELRALSYENTLKFYDEILKANSTEALRWLCRNDRFFLLGAMMMRADVLSKRWCFDRCREVEKEPDGRLDLWSRFHYKSTIITLAGSVQEILKDPNITIGVLSYNKSIAKAFIGQIKRALEIPELVSLFPDILYTKPPNTDWSAQAGLIVKRSGNPKEPTIMGSGLVDGQPIGTHFALRIYDDVVVPSSVTNPEQIKKTTEAWELSLALGTDDGGRAWYAGTRYHPDDTYAEILRRGSLKERRRLCMDEEGNPTMMTKEALENIKKDMGQFTFAAQMLQNPVADGVRAFNDNWIANCHYTKLPPRSTCNCYIVIDGANSGRSTADYTTMWVIFLGPDMNYYCVPAVHSHLNLEQRTRKLFELHRKYRPNMVFWEQVGAMSDVSHVEYVMNNVENYRFPIVRVNRGNKDNKKRRIISLQAPFAEHRIWLPRLGDCMEAWPDGSVHDNELDFETDEYGCYPNSKHDDMLDSLADINDEEVAKEMRWPKAGTIYTSTDKYEGWGGKDNIFAR